MSKSELRIIREGLLDHPAVQDLLRLHLAAARAATPPGFSFALDLSGLRAPEISFYSAWQGDSLLAIGALKALNAEDAEVKSMRTAPAHLRKGAAAFVVDHLITTARARGFKRLLLETGTDENYAPAVALYRAQGFHFCGAFADYQPSPHNQFMALPL